MIKFLSNWVESISIAIIIVSIFELVLPKGNLKKYLKIVLGIYVMFCIISPFVNAKDLFNFNNVNEDLKSTAFETKYEDEETSMNKRIEELYIEQIKKDIEGELKKIGYKTIKCKIDAKLYSDNTDRGISKISLIIKSNSISDIEKIEVKVFNKEIENKNKEDINKIKSIISEKYEISKDIITVKITN